jgi:NAD(P)-dependent dehydrogenase (short-subunit alcohol dehydrogenase family)
MVNATPEPQVVLVVGGSRGIGLATAREFARQGAVVVLAARGPDSLDAAAAECRREGAADTLVVQVDVADYASVQALVDRAIERFGRLDVVVQSAAVVAYGKFEHVPPEVFDRVVTTGILGTANVARAVLPHLKSRRSGTLLVMGSVLGHMVAPTMSSYATTKWGIRGLVRTLQVEARGSGVSIVLIAPGSIDTGIYESAANYVGRLGRPPWPVFSAEKVARAAMRAVAHPRREIQVGAANRVMSLGYTVLPPVFDLAVGPLMNVLGRGKRIPPTEGNVFVATERAGR